jgi:hypothetical protein
VAGLAVRSELERPSRGRHPTRHRPRHKALIHKPTHHGAGELQPQVAYRQPWIHAALPDVTACDLEAQRRGAVDQRSQAVDTVAGPSCGQHTRGGGRSVGENQCFQRKET